MSLTALALAALVAACLANIEIFDYDPVANPAAVVISGNARFTVLTPNVCFLPSAVMFVTLADTPAGYPHGILDDGLV